LQHIPGLFILDRHTSLARTRGRPETTSLSPPSTLGRLRPGGASCVAGFAVVFDDAVLKILDVSGACSRFSGLGDAIMHRAEDLRKVISELITPSLKEVREDLSGLNNRLETFESELGRRLERREDHLRIQHEQIMFMLMLWALRQKIEWPLT
jgi:hypothetical protein